MLTYVVIGAAVLLLVALNVSTRLSYRRLAPKLVPTIHAMRKLTGQSITHRPFRADESIPANAAPLFDAAQRELTASGLTVLGDLMEVPPDGDPKPTRWFVDGSGTICGWFGVARTTPVMFFFSEAARENFFITARGASSTGTAQPPTNHREYLGWEVGVPDILPRHKARIAQAGMSAIPQPATLEAGTAVLDRLRDSTTRWRSAQPFHALLEQDVRTILGDRWKYLGPRLVRLLTET